MDSFLSFIPMSALPQQAWYVFGVIFPILICASVFVQWLKRKGGYDNEFIANLSARVHAWWVMVSVLLLAFLFGRIGVIVLFFLISFAVLRELVALICKHDGDSRVIVACFCILLPFHYYLLFVERYDVFFVFVPVCGFLLLPVIASLGGKTERFLEKTSKTQWMVMVSIFCLSHVPALMSLNIKNFSKEKNVLLVIFMIVVVQSSDVLQYVWGKSIGKRKILPSISPSKTIAGTVGGIASATLVAALMSPLTPFSSFQSALIGLVVCLMGFCGGLVMSAIKRDYGIKDWGNMIKGHGGVLDRVDSICFSAPVFFYIVRYWGLS